MSKIRVKKEDPDCEAIIFGFSLGSERRQARLEIIIYERELERGEKNTHTHLDKGVGAWGDTCNNLTVSKSLFPSGSSTCEISL